MSTGTSNYPKVTCIRSTESLTSKSQICRILTNFLQAEKGKLEVHPRHCMYWQDILQLTGTLATTSREKRKLADLQPTDPFALMHTTSPTGAADRAAADAVESEVSSPVPVTKQAAAVTITQRKVVDHKELTKIKDEGPSPAKSKEEEKEDRKARKAAKKARKVAKKAKKESKKRKHENL